MPVLSSQIRLLGRLFLYTTIGMASFLRLPDVASYPSTGDHRSPEIWDKQWVQTPCVGRNRRKTAQRTSKHQGRIRGYAHIPYPLTSLFLSFSKKPSPMPQ